MKLFWKIFFSVMAVTTVVFCVSGHILIYSFFKSELTREIEEADMQSKAFGKSLNVSVLMLEKDGVVSDEELLEGSSTVSLADNKKTVQVNLYSEAGELLEEAEEDGTSVDRGVRELIQKTDKGKEGYTILRDGESYALHFVSFQEIAERGRGVHIELVRDITGIFQQKDDMYEIYMRCMFVLLVVTILAAAVLTAWIVRPIKRLTAGVNEFARGNFTERIQITGQDELGHLAEQFNKMGEQINSSMEELRMAAVRQEQFTGSFAHELKTPLTSIIGYAEMLRTRKMPEETRMQYGDYIFRQGKRLESLAKKMMDITVLEKAEIQKKNIWVPGFLEEIAGEMAPVCEKHDVCLSVNAHDDLMLCADPELLKSVILNLIDNSIKALEREGKIWITAEGKEHIIEIAVIDNGKGIAKEDLPRVTESFFMGDKSRKNDGSGSVGLGLAISRRIVELHHAKMKISSKEGIETKVIIQFPEVR